MNLDPEPLEQDLGRSGPVMNRVGTGPGNDRLSLATSLVALLVMLAILKPWGAGPAAAPPRPPRTQVPVAAAPTPRPTDDSADGLARPICLGAGAWRVATLETWRTQDVRVWRAVEPVGDATGPLDPTIPSVPVVALEIEALGWCAPAYGADRPVGPTAVTAWFVVGERAAEMRLRQVLPEGAVTPIAALYEPQGACAPRLTCPTILTPPGPQRWATGRVVFRYEDLGAHRVSWFAADLEIVTPAAAPPGTSPSPGS